jgi:CelD/BcsL family acetyltransferase involved in cellulose biosynthesis
MNVITTQVIASFDDPAVRPELWSRLLGQGDTRTGILTWQSQRLWWQENQRLGELLLVVASRNGDALAIAPLFVASGMAMNLCPVNTLDMIGDVSDPELLDAILRAAARNVEGFVGLRFHFVPDTSRTGRLLKESAGRLGWQCYVEDDLPSPIIDLQGKPTLALVCTRKKTVLRRENQLRRKGTLAVEHFRDWGDVLPQLDLFFDQHVERWAETETPSKFLDAHHRESFRRRTEELSHSGWLRFSRLDWKDRPIAFHRGSCYQGHYKYGRTSYANEVAEYSPGTVLLRHVLLDAIDERAHTFDFGLGDEAYKYRYATDVVHVQTWGLYSSTS